MTKDKSGTWRIEDNLAVDSAEKPWSATNGYWECHFQDDWEALYWLAHMMDREDEDNL